jgi:hypothetical protein
MKRLLVVWVVSYVPVLFGWFIFYIDAERMNSMFSYGPFIPFYLALLFLISLVYGLVHAVVKGWHRKAAFGSLLLVFAWVLTDPFMYFYNIGSWLFLLLYFITVLITSHLFFVRMTVQAYPLSLFLILVSYLAFYNAPICYWRGVGLVNYWIS